MSNILATVSCFHDGKKHENKKKLGKEIILAFHATTQDIRRKSTTISGNGTYHTPPVTCR